MEMTNEEKARAWDVFTGMVKADLADTDSFAMGARLAGKYGAVYIRGIEKIIGKWREWKIKNPGVTS